MPDADIIRLLLFFKQQIGYKKSTQNKEERDGIKAIFEQWKIFQVHQSIFFPDGFGMMHHNKKSSNKS